MKTLDSFPLEGFNRKPLDEDDFFKICANENITVLERRVPTAFYMRCERENVIVLKQGERGLRRLFSAYHELGHYFLHGGEGDAVALFRGPRSSKEEMEADAFAAIAICPQMDLQSFHWLDRHSDKFAPRVWLIRNHIFATYGI